MKKILFVFAVLSAFILISAVPLMAVKPGNDVNPNGFPAGTHFNLNLIGKKLDFICPEQEYYLLVTADNNGDGDLNQLVEECDLDDVCEQSNKPIYGNVIFIPESGDGAKISIQSGTGKKASEILDLQVVDPCATDSDGAIVQLPKNEAGYHVYARALGKPGTADDPRSLSTTPQLKGLEDDDGSQIFFLGEMNDKGFETSDGYIYRTKGKSKALDITRMFEWSGLICSGEYFEGSTEGYQYCSGSEESELLPPSVVDGVATCPDGYILSSYYCTEYATPTWIFNIEAFVEYMWSVDNKGMKLLQIRFYPIINTEAGEES